MTTAAAASTMFTPPSAGGEPAPAPAATPTPTQAATAAPTIDTAGAPFEQPWLEKVGGGKYKTVDAFLKGHGEVEALVGKQGAELGELRKLSEAVKGIDPDKAKAVLGAPKAEDGTPLPYDLKVPEGRELLRDDPRLTAFNDVAHELNLSGTAAQALFDKVFVPWAEGEEAGVQAFEQERTEALVAYYGNDPATMQAKVADLSNWAAEAVGMDPEALKDLEGAFRTAEGIRSLDRLRVAMENVKAGRSAGDSTPTSEAEILKMMSDDPKWASDPAKKRAFDLYTQRAAAELDAQDQ